MRNKLLASTAFAVLGAILAGCAASTTPEAAVETPAPVIAETKTEEPGLIPFETYELENGLKVIFHKDTSDPVVAVSLTAHVGSAREKPGRTGFAHLFEHLLFLESENLGKGGLDQLSARIGGSGANGSTSRDRTNYLQTVPNDALEKMIWAEADKLGWFINTVTVPVLEKEKQVVKNEKRQSVDNRPYGHEFYVIGKALYPEDHPYNWQVIGSLEDLQASTVEDVSEFFRTWYTPNNVTLVLAGDFDSEQAKVWVEKYFAEIPRGPEISPLEKRPAVLTESKKLFHEDNFANLPQLTMVWPAVELYHPDSYPLQVLLSLLTDGKEAPLNEVLIDEKKLTAGVGAFDYTSEISGDIILQVQGFDGTNLNNIAAAIGEGFDRFESDGIDPEDLQRIKTGLEVDFYSGIGTVLGKGVQLARYSIFAGDPGAIDQDLKRLQSVSAEDVMRVYETYIKDKPFVATSFVPKGQTDLILDGSTRAAVVEEPIIQGAEAAVDPNVVATYDPTPSSFDRSIEPPYGAPPTISPPAVWKAELSNGLSVAGIEDNELPLVRMALRIDGGHKLDTVDTAGTANLVAQLLTRGTANRTPAELEKALDLLGASVSASAGTDGVFLNVETLARTFDETMALVEEILLEPRFDEEEFELAKARILNRVRGNRAQPVSLANAAASYVTYGADNIMATNPLGSESSLQGISLEDIKDWSASYLKPNVSTALIAGDVSQDAVIAALSGLEEKWARGDVTLPELDMPEAPETSKVFFYDVPGAKQSIIYFTRPALVRSDPDFNKVRTMNYRLGGGGFASRLTQQLREGKGYTYGIFSQFDAASDVGTFDIFSRVRSNVTLEASQLVKEIMEQYPGTYTESDLDVTKSFYSKSAARRFESLGAKLNMLGDITRYDLAEDYVASETAEVAEMSVEDMKAMANAYIKPGAMNYVIVGDAATQLERMSELGFGDPVLINEAVDALSD